ncbi:alpha/beta hydrolase [Methylobacterium sp. E-045]|uniref:alpha/beta hydrolase n=1 Tax=Methylobacterium sp. E-045 TaxID=2836575 RepID=UPI001FB8F79B|nr:alpha/beta fold hydrolase [Methylobacterium sp. E-045]MCJ2128302.1 alpha/beta hydrolase [Methylobacterium sp. E-045]
MPDAGIQEGRFFTSDLSASNNTKVQIYGQYTTAAGLGQDAVAPGLDQSKTLLILLHGLTYDHDYWDMPEIGSQYSFVEAAKNDGYDTLAIDRLGEGQSSKPSADLVNVDNQAYITDQIIQQIRAGGLGTNYDKIILVGHSYGSVLSIKTAGTYNDVDGVVLTGLAHGTSSPDSTGLFVPASTDPNLPPEQQQPGYLTSADRKKRVFLQYRGRRSACHRS